MIIPSRREFRELSRSGRSVPVAARLPAEADPKELFQAADFKGPKILLESARTHPVTGRYSLIVGEPASGLTAKGGRILLEEGQGRRPLSGNPLLVLKNLLESRPAVRIPGFPPFVGGAVGFFGYDCFQYCEEIRPTALDDLGLPDLRFLFFDQAAVLDHREGKLWVIALAAPSADPDRAYDRAVARIDSLVQRATRSPQHPPSFNPKFAIRNSQFKSTHTQASFETMVRRAKEFIAQGEIYQANLSQRFSTPMAAEPWEFYERLTAINPSPFAAYAEFGDFQVISASPERFLKVQGWRVETRPIAGTRPKGNSAVETARLRQELILNEKERAEHLMLVDLERNDLGRVCRHGSVRVDEWMALEEYSHVIHIVSNVRGTLRPEIHPLDLIPAAFPGGTITGCPKIRSIQIIDQLEPVRRQLYTGSLGYVSFTGDMDFNLLIRTALAARGNVYLQAGAGIVADSDPGREYEETLHKAQALREALGDAAVIASHASGGARQSHELVAR